MSLSREMNIGSSTLILGQGNEDINIKGREGQNVRINGVVPGAGGGGGGPYDGPGDITLTPGNLTAVGDGISNGKIEGQTIKSIDNIVISSGNLEVTTGGVEIKGNGNLTLEGNGEVKTEGGGNITAGLAGDIQTTTGDIVSGNDIYFEGQDIYHRTNNPVANLSYKDYKQLAGKNDNNVFTGSNQFNSNTTEFAAKVSVGTRDGGGLFTQNLALNTSGNVECKTINNATQIQCGNINCGNGGDNEVRARKFITRTNENNLPVGWTLEQGLPNSPAEQVDRVLQIKAGEASGYITITPTDFTGTDPAIILDPNTTANGGKIYAASFTFGSTADRFDLIQDLTGPLNHTLQISAPTASSKVEFSDNNTNVILGVNKTDINLGNTIPIKFGLYSFLPVQYTLTNASFPIEQTEQAFTKIFTNSSSFTNVNTGATGQSLVEGFYKLSVTQTGASTPSGTYEKIGVLCDYVYRIPSDASPDNQLPNPLSFSYGKYDTTGPPEIEIRRNATGGQDVHMTFPTLAGSSGESMPILVKLTKLDF